MELPMTQYNTNLAAEFYVLSMLYRIGAEASLTLGNKKAVDIIVSKFDGTTLTIDVKGVAKAYDWPINPDNVTDSDTHYFVLLTFEGKIADPLYAPNVWVIPSKVLKEYMRLYGTRWVAMRKKILHEASEYLNNWSPFKEKEND
jgi:hypothetical protein